MKNVTTEKFCLCGCGEALIVRSYHKYQGYIGYKAGHSIRGKPSPAKGKTFPPRTPEVKRIVSEKCKGQKRTDAQRKRMSNGRRIKSIYQEVDMNEVLYCKCGCGETIKILRTHMYRKPKYIIGHHQRTKEGRERCRLQRLKQEFKQRDTNIELLLQSALKDENINFIKHKPIKIGNLLMYPDIFIEPNICIFADGDYWHAFPGKYTAEQVLIENTTAMEIWAYDENANITLTKKGYKVLRFWEHDILDNINFCISEVQTVLR